MQRSSAPASSSSCSGLFIFQNFLKNCIAELEERLRTIRAAQKKEEDSEIIRAIRSTKMGGRELLALLDNIQAGNVTFLTAVNNASEEAETEEAIEKDA